MPITDALDLDRDGAFVDDALKGGSILSSTLLGAAFGGGVPGAIAGFAGGVYAGAPIAEEMGDFWSDYMGSRGPVDGRCLDPDYKGGQPYAAGYGQQLHDKTASPEAETGKYLGAGIGGFLGSFAGPLGLFPGAVQGSMTGGAIGELFASRF